MNLVDRDLRQDLRLVTAPLRAVPDFILVGEAKCGTTSLFRYLSSHPRIAVSDRKEPNNFIDYPGSLLRARSHYPLLPGLWLRALSAGGRILPGEASAEYFSRRRLPDTIATLLPEARILVLLRDPVRRALSDHQMLSRAGVVDEDFDALVENAIRWLSEPALLPLLEDAGEYEHSSIRIVLRGLYRRSLERWFGRFGRDRVLVVISEELFEDPAAVCRRVFEFLGIEPLAIGDRGVRRPGGYDPGRYADARRLLADFYAPHNRQLESLLGRSLPWGPDAAGNAG